MLRSTQYFVFHRIQLSHQLPLEIIVSVLDTESTCFTVSFMLPSSMATPEQEFVRLHVQPFHGRDGTPASEIWLPCLEIPVHRLAEFSFKPYRWLCYAGYCIMGAEGGLSFDQNSADFDYDAPFHPSDLYYHTHGPIFPIDPDIENASRTSYDSDYSDVSPFKSSILERDKSCRHCYRL